jgi:hypothetical protein
VGNDGDLRRVVLVREAWHPDLDDREREAMHGVYGRLINEASCA